MLDEFSRTELLIGQAALHHLHRCKVAVFGLGGVGSYTVEALARAGIGHFVLVDDDKVCLTNINRQLLATHRTLGRLKVDVMRERILDINPAAVVETHPVFFLPGTAPALIRPELDYLVDAIDTVSAKIELVVQAKDLGIPIISCMGAGNKMDPTRFQVDDLFRTTVDPLCKVMRKELKKRGITALKVVYSTEEPMAADIGGRLAEDRSDRLPAANTETPSSCHSECICPPGAVRKCTHRRRIPGSMSFVPSVAGLIMAGVVVRDLIAGLQPGQTNTP
jgi:tRNA A37 threonylcarbamoyladenosine dehydratase